MSQRVNRQVKLVARPVGLPKTSDWEHTADVSIRDLDDGEFLVAVRYISLDPAMRGWMNETRSYIAPVTLGDVMRAGAVGQVVESKNDGFAVGDHVSGMLGVQAYAVSDGRGVHKVDPGLAPLSHYLGGLGMPGLSAYFGLLEIGKPKEGETVLISGAAGAVGSVAGQIAKIKGARAVGIAGGPEKCAHIVETLGFDAAIDYKNQNVRKRIEETCPGGVDVYFDNVGGEILDLALARLNQRSRVVICGAISQYNATSAVKGPQIYLSLLVNRARMEGFVVFDYAKRYGEAFAQLATWMKAGQFQCDETIVDGLENFNETFLRLFSGDKRGKLILRV